MGECDTHRFQARHLHPEFLAEKENVFREPPVTRLLEERLADGGGRFALFCDLARHEAEGIRFLRGAEILPPGDCGSWDREAHLRDELRHLSYFTGLARREAPDRPVPAPNLAPLSASERSVFESPRDFLISLYVAELFSAAYLRALRDAQRGQGDQGGRPVSAVIGRVLRDEAKHARWVGSAIDLESGAVVHARLRAHWRDLEIAFLEDLLASDRSAGKQPG